MDIELEVFLNKTPHPIGDTFNLILKEKNGTRLLPIVIGSNEGKTIVLTANQFAFNRPIAHDLLCQLCEKLELTVSYVHIFDFLKGTYFVHICILHNNSPLLIDARISDAVIVALKKNIPIYIDSRIFENNCYSDHKIFYPKNINDEIRNFWNPNTIDTEDLPFNLQLISTQQLQNLLEESLEQEQYELAAEIDAELKRRSQ